MTFRVVPNPTFTHKVYVMVPIDGSYREETMKVTFKVRSQTELFEHNLSTPEGTESYCRAIVDAIGDLTDESGQAVEPSEETYNLLFGLPYVQVALIRAYTLALSKARTKN